MVELYRTNSMAPPTLAHWPRTPACHCFDLCTTGDVLRLVERLPLYNDTASPWRHYLAAVYGKPPPLPVDLRARLQVFYPGLLPTSTHRCRGNPWQGEPNASAINQPPCDAETCARWLRSEEEAPLRWLGVGWARHSSHIWTPITEPWHPELVGPQRAEWHSRLQLGREHLFVALQPAQRAPFPSGAWVEVMHVTMGWFGEHKQGSGRWYGCWFWPLSGSGVWVNVGRTLVAGNAYDANRLLRNESSSRDNFFANGTRALGFDSLQILRGQGNYGGSKSRYHMRTEPAFEIVVASGGCDGSSETHQEARACVPLPLRAGWSAERPCSCDESATPFINCRGE